LAQNDKRFCAPELLDKVTRQNYLDRVDEYSVGVLLYYMLTGGEFPHDIKKKSPR